jgi:hypothetical protein
LDHWNLSNSRHRHQPGSTDQPDRSCTLIASLIEDDNHRQTIRTLHKNRPWKPQGRRIVPPAAPRSIHRVGEHARRGGIQRSPQEAIRIVGPQSSEERECLKKNFSWRLLRSISVIPDDWHESIPWPERTASISPSPHMSNNGGKSSDVRNRSKCQNRIFRPNSLGGNCGIRWPPGKDTDPHSFALERALHGVCLADMLFDL